MCLWMWFAEVGLANGAVFILDMNGCVFGHIKKINLMACKKFITYIQDAIPVRLKAIHIINTLPFLDIILGMLKPLMKKELYDLIKLHPTLDTLYPHVPQEVLPREYGGTADSIQEIHEKTIEQLLDNVEFFKQHENQKTDETKRVGKAVTASELFGVEGTFKKLDID